MIEEIAMPRFGAHMSISGGLHRALELGHSIGCQAIQLFTRNSTRWKAPPRTAQELDLFKQTQAQTGIAPVVAHAIYLINPASPDEDVRIQSYAALVEELHRCHEAGIPYLVIHPGSHKETGLDQGIARVAEAINRARDAHPEYADVIILLENTAGQGATIGRTFEELAQITAQIEAKELIGYCLDTAHAFASGYDLRTAEGYANTMTQFERILGLERLRCIHLNDSHYGLATGKDRHHHIGQGHLGLAAFRHLVNDPRLADLPMLLETPKGEDLREDIENLAILRSLLEN